MPEGRSSGRPGLLGGSRTLRSLLPKRLALATAAVLLTLALGEVAARIYAAHITERWQQASASPHHYIRESPDPILGYELRPGVAYTIGDHRLAIDERGLREEHPRLDADRVLAIAGDSVVFGTAHSQEATIPELVERELARTGGESVEVLNLGVPGYGAAEIARFVSRHVAAARPEATIYLMNLNDFARRGTLYEGTGYGYYRYYHRPPLELPLLGAKVVNKWVMGGNTSPRWYGWIAEGTFAKTMGAISEMRSAAREAGSSFAVAILPAGSAFTDGGGYELAGLHERIAERLGGDGIPVLDLRAVLEEAGPAEAFDETDHLTGAGNAAVATVLSGWFDELAGDPAHAEPQ